jgi:DNA-binding NtrC family response regulator
MARGGIIAAEHISFPGQEAKRPIDVAQAIADGVKLDDFLKDAESRYLREALRQGGGELSVAASLIGLSVKELQKLLDRAAVE